MLIDENCAHSEYRKKPAWRRYVWEKKFLKVSNAKQQEHCILEIRLEHIDPVPQNRKPKVQLTMINSSPQLTVRSVAEQDTSLQSFGSLNCAGR